MKTSDAHSGTTFVRGEPFVSSWQPSGWSSCLIHEPAAPDLVDYTGSSPLPAAISSASFVGCDTRLPAGKHTVDFTRQNSPYFDEVARRLTNGADEMAWDLSFLVDDDLIPYGLGGGGEWESRDDWKRGAARSSGKTAAADLAGFTIDRLRLNADFGWSTEPAPEGFSLKYNFSVSWEVYGRRA